MTRGSIWPERLRCTLVFVLGAATAAAQGTPAHATCRDPHPAPVCGSYFLFDFNAGGRIGGTTVMTNVRERPALPSWFGWDVGWMKNVSPSRSLGGSLEIGGNGDGTRVALRARHRSWLDHNLVVDASAGPLMSQIQNEFPDGVTPTYGATADLGLGRARLGLATLGADMASQRGKQQFAMHGGVRVESTGVIIVSAVAAVAGLIALAALRDATYY